MGVTPARSSDSSTVTVAPRTWRTRPMTVGSGDAGTGTNLAGKECRELVEVTKKELLPFEDTRNFGLVRPGSLLPIHDRLVGRQRDEIARGRRPRLNLCRNPTMTQRDHFRSRMALRSIKEQFVEMVVAEGIAADERDRLRLK